MQTNSRRAWIAGAGAAVLAASLATGGSTGGHHDDGKYDHGKYRGDSRAAKNVILVVGDGLSIAAREAIRLYTVGQDGELAMDSLRYAGWTHTDSLDPDEAVTDSAAAATAFATGVRTYNGAVSVDIDGDPVRTLLEHANRLRKATGLVTTAQVTDATPAAFGAHVPDRGDQSEIARQYIEETKPDVILGGGEDWWYPTGDPGAYPDDPADPRPEVSRSEIGNLVEQAQDEGYDYVTTAAQLAATDSDQILGLFANEEMFEHREEGDGDLYEPAVPLHVMARKALRVLSRDRDGFFVLIEEEAIDEMAHENNARLMIKSGQALDRTVRLAVRFARTHPGTLIVVQGDHETGGLTIENPDDEDESGEELSREDGPFPVKGTDLEVFADWTTGQHTGVDTPITASGPGSKRFDGVIDNTDVHDAIEDAMRRRRR
jgi:alkaline phosphatase